MKQENIKNLKINMDKVEEIINDEVNRRVKNKFKKIGAIFSLVVAGAGVAIGGATVLDSAVKQEEAINAAKNREYIEQWEDAHGQRWAEFINEDNDDFEVEGDGYTGTYKGR